MSAPSYPDSSDTSAPSPAASAASQVADSPASPSLWLLVLLFLLTLAAYGPALKGSLLWDDEGHLTHPLLRSTEGLARIWSEPGATQQYYPLLHSAFWFEHQLWGDSTLGYHLVNVLWHSLSAFLLIVLLRRLRLPGALFAGMLFALHPVCVESVAWISEQKNTLSTCLALAAALAWLRFADTRRLPAYLLASLLFVAALLTKTVTATLPAALLVIEWWRHGRLSWRCQLAPLLPWLLLGVGAGLGTAHFEAVNIGASGDDFALGYAERVLLAGRVVWFYLAKLVWPADLAFFYSRWTLDAHSAWQWLFPAATLALLAFALWWSRRDRSLLAAALLYGGMLVPVLGFVNVYPFLFSFVADHFQYLASLAMLSFLAAAATKALGKRNWPAWTGPALAACVLATLGTLTWRQSRAYEDVYSLYGHTLERTPTSWVAHLNLGTALADGGRSEQGLPHLQRALELKPDHPDTLNSLGNVLNQLGRPAEARPLLERALQKQPRFATAHNTLGATLMALGKPQEGITSFQRALELNPALTQARVNLGWALANTGRVAAGLEQLSEARRRQPDYADAFFKTGLVYAMTRKPAEALSPLRQAVELQPADPEARYILGCVLLDLGRASEAGDRFEEALQLAPSHAGAQRALAQLQSQGRR